MKKILGFLNDHIEEFILVPGFAVMLFINFGNVLSRYLFHNSWAFTEELGVILFVYISFFGAAVAVKRRQHLGFTLLLDNVPKVVRIIADTLITIAIIVFMGAMIYYGIKVCENQIKYHSTTAALRIPLVYANASIPIGGVFIIVRTIQVYVQDMICHIQSLHGKEGA
ncbi:MAG: TRAP transporter small permease [Tepidanaerobacteraceae bacterium]|nr:TRAP transporter small permease [Tepidanaerobacteraceae bacterium]